VLDALTCAGSRLSEQFTDRFLKRSPRLMDVELPPFRVKVAEERDEVTAVSQLVIR
jgi:hypothetical protein